MKLTALVGFSLAFDDRNTTSRQIVEENGFQFEEHQVITEDGYILNLHRIAQKSSKVVLLQHGMFAQSADWFVNDRHKSVAFQLADAGYDVWMGNNRGTKWSLGHQNLTIQDRAYWQFSWEEFSLYDVPAEIQYALDQTADNNPSGMLTYIGHSMGTSQFFAGSALMSDWYAEKVNLFAALAPVVRYDLGHPSLAKVAEHYKILEAIIELVGYYQVFYFNQHALHLLTNFCYYTGEICGVLFEQNGHFNEIIENTKRSYAMYAHDPAGDGYKTLVHFAQNMAAGKFQRYDHGKIGNLKKYGQADPPEIKLDQIKVPVALFTGDVDDSADPVDVAWLEDPEQSGLNSVVFKKQYHFYHVSFQMAEDMSYVADDLVPLMDSYHE